MRSRFDIKIAVSIMVALAVAIAIIRSIVHLSIEPASLYYVSFHEILFGIRELTGRDLGVDPQLGAIRSGIQALFAVSEVEHVNPVLAKHGAVLARPEWPRLRGS